jgi:DNA ligase-1
MKYKKIKKVHEIEDFEDFRYDIEVENTNCFFADSILVHNCRAFSLRHLGDDRILSRERHEFAGDAHVENVLEEVFGPDSPDGEIYKHGWSFQQIISMLKKWYNRGENPDYPELASEDLEYWVYDLAIPVKKYEERREMLDNLIPFEHPIIKVVRTERCDNLEEVKKWHDYFVAQGFEGLIIRDPKTEYAFNDRNWSLIKYKEFKDREWPIVGSEIEDWEDPLTGTSRKLILWVCETEQGNTFVVRPVGSFQERERLAESPTDHYGKFLTVRFQELSEDGTPIFGTGRGFAEGLIVRDYE